MKIISFVIMIMIMTVPCTNYAQSTTAPSPCEVTLILKKQVYPVGDPIRVTVVIRNLSPRGIRIIQGSEKPRFEVFCEGKRADDTRQGKIILDAYNRLYPLTMAASSGSVLKGDATEEMVLPMSRLVDLTTVGKYEAVLRLNVHELTDLGIGPLISVESKKITFELREPNELPGN